MTAQTATRRISSPSDAAVLIDRLESNVATVVRGKRDVIRLATVCLLARGHLLIEDVPGVGKTTLAQALARSVGLDFRRIQFTSDLLPSDILGVSIFDPDSREFEFRPGPIFSSVVLADEINRATPKTQSALFEAMSERRVSTDTGTLDLPSTFTVIATQNPLEYVGTFPLPESQLDRFMMSLRIGYASAAFEKELILSGGVQRTLDVLRPSLSGLELEGLQLEVQRVKVSEKMADFMLALAHATRNSKAFSLGVSTRGVEALCRATQALALCDGRSFVVPDDVQTLAPWVLGHRVVLASSDSSLETTRREIGVLAKDLPVPL